MSFHVGEEVGDYRIVSILGAGTIGRVFQVEHRANHSKRAMKVLAAAAVTDSQFLRFMREIEIQGRLSHPNIARVHQALHCKDSLILVMESVEGRSLEKLLQNGRLPVLTAIDYISQTLSGLQYAHAHGVVHRDVTPGNLMVTADGCIKLTDFGLAKSVGDHQLTNDGDIVGSLYYMPPEQVRQHMADPDPRSDIYSTGAVLYELLTGKKIFQCSDRLSLMVAQVQKQPTPLIEIAPEIPEELNAIVLKALAKDPAHRFQSAEEFRLALQRAGNFSRSKGAIAACTRTAALVFAACAMAQTGSLENVPPPAPIPTPVPVVVRAEVPAVEPPPAAPVKPRQHRAIVQAPIALEPDTVSETFVETKPVTVEQPIEKVSEPIADAQPAAPAEKKRHFWNKLNPFKHHRAEPSR
ncbi:MAG TPA: serine/threonine-protein kinase [Bryobacteraceae bacterium]|nr:serine/threonine-protein kinase [Bryobacteraceae bacterium]